MVIDLNADLGEGFGIWTLGDDVALLDVVTSANVACGFHAGDPVTIRRTCAAAVDRGVSIGAQVSYRDLAHFGRREMDVEPEELCAEVLYQLAAVDGIARAMGGRVSYVKPHGALYNRICRDPAQAAAVVDAVADYDPSLPILTLPGSAVHAAAAAEGVSTVTEAFADRAYTPAGALVPRREPGAVLHDVEAVSARAVRMAVEGTVTAADGGTVEVRARSICVHGDTPGAVRMARAVRDGLLEAGVVLQAFA
ncbi:LamB/YcsF family protein [Nonomuraea sp. SMC257]|uniref:5-oxoprolinase subunit A n=1 Tax=Nonomuraea montanisoli TaxID=2741721 RepID=A0A7Y6I4N7_9ACTN|nr:5-oxoprolinase subunit PxpA [Nonomuraea montanisoli]NUW30685.1 LamB/YcsF family protein [Nonomuraea montanisoli]